MDWKALFLTADGRIGQRDFWIGFLILFVAGIVLGMVPVLGQLISILLIYPWVCLYAKRLHDFGKSGWLMLVPLGVWLAAMVFGIIAGGVGIAGAAIMGGNGYDNAAATAAMSGFGAAAGLMMLAGIVNLLFLLWVGLTKGDPADNRFGPPPGKLITSV